MSGGLAMPLRETWTFVAPRTDGRWEVRCTRCRRAEMWATADGAQQSLSQHQCGLRVAR